MFRVSTAAVLSITLRQSLSHRDLHTAENPVPSVNMTERSSIHGAGRSHLQLCPCEEASEAEDMAAAIRHGEFASSQDAQADRTPLRLLAVCPIRRALATASSSNHVRPLAVVIPTFERSCGWFAPSKRRFSVQILLGNADQSHNLGIVLD